MGKSFAELVMKFTFPMYFYYFDFELVEEAHKKVRPVPKLGAMENMQIPMKFKIRNKMTVAGSE